MIPAIISGGVAIFLALMAVAWRLGALSQRVTDLAVRIAMIEQRLSKLQRPRKPPP